MNPTRNNIPALDALRGVACLLVVLAHAGGLKVFFDIRGAGQIGVMLFFALSGFLMYILYGNQPITAASLRAYGLRRFFRVVPAFVVVVLASWLGYRTGLFTLYAIDSSEAWKHLTLRGEVSVLWTIAVELKFYLFFPLVIMILAKLSGPRQELVALTLLYGAFVAMEFEAPKSFWRYTEFFLGGMIAGSIYLQVSPSDSARRWINVGFIVLLGLLVLSISRFINLIPGVTSQLWRDPLPYSIMVSLTVLAAAWISPPVANMFANPAMRFIGRISFSLYLIHLPTMRLVLANLENYGFLNLPIAIVAAVVAAWLMYRVIELPGQSLGRRILQHRR